MQIIEKSSRLNELVGVSAADGQKVFFLVGGTVTLTLLLNAMLSKLILRALGLVEDGSLEELVMGHVTG